MSDARFQISDFKLLVYFDLYSVFCCLSSVVCPLSSVLCHTVSGGLYSPHTWRKVRQISPVVA